MFAARRLRYLVQTRQASFFNKADRDWEKAWQLNLTPWDLKGTVSPPLVQAIENGSVTTTGKHALIPGCGSGYECIYLRKAGFSQVTGMDISKTAVQAAQKNVEASGLDHITVQEANFFTLDDKIKYDFIFDYLFFAALDPEYRISWAKSMQTIIQPGTGVLSTLIFPLYQSGEDKNAGPPYPVSLEDYESVLKPLNFELIKVDKDINSIKPRKGREIMAYWSLKQ